MKKKQFKSMITIFKTQSECGSIVNVMFFNSGDEPLRTEDLADALRDYATLLDTSEEGPEN